MKKIIFLGSRGRLGRAFYKYGNFPGYEKVFLTDRIEDSSFADTFDLGKEDIVVNCAAYTDVKKADQGDSLKCMRANCFLPIMIADKKNERPFKLVLFSSDYVIRKGFSGSYEESKKNMEALCKDSCLIIRLANLVGENDLEEGRSNIVSKILSQKVISAGKTWIYPTLLNQESINILSKIILNDCEGETVNCFGPQRYFPTFVRKVLDISGKKNKIEMNFENKNDKIKGCYTLMSFDWDFLRSFSDGSKTDNSGRAEEYRENSSHSVT